MQIILQSDFYYTNNTVFSCKLRYFHDSHYVPYVGNTTMQENWAAASFPVLTEATCSETHTHREPDLQA